MIYKLNLFYDHSETYIMLIQLNIKYNPENKLETFMLEKIFNIARRKAWRKISNTDIVRGLIEEQRLEKERQLQKQLETTLLTMYK